MHAFDVETTVQLDGSGPSGSASSTADLLASQQPSATELGEAAEATHGDAAAELPKAPPSPEAPQAADRNEVCAAALGGPPRADTGEAPEPTSYRPPAFPAHHRSFPSPALFKPSLPSKALHKGCYEDEVAYTAAQDYFILSEMEQAEKRKGGEPELGWQTAHRIASLHQARPLCSCAAAVTAPAALCWQPWHKALFPGIVA